MKSITAAVVAIVGSSVALSSTVAAQTRSVRDTATAYGARLNAKGQPAAANQKRLNSRINSRIDNRLSLRIERYNPDSTASPTAVFQATQNDKSRATPVLAPPSPDVPQ